MSTRARSSTRGKAAPVHAAEAEVGSDESASASSSLQSVLSTLKARHITHDPSGDLAALRKLAHGTPMSAFRFDRAKWRWLSVPRTPEATLKNPNIFLLVDHAEPPTRFLRTSAGIPCSNRGAKDHQIFWTSDLSKMQMPAELEAAQITAGDVLQDEPVVAGASPASSSAASPSARKRKQTDEEKESQAATSSAKKTKQKKETAADK